VTLAFAEPGVDFPPQHYAFLVSDEEFDAVLERIVALGIDHWADPHGTPGINTNHGGRGVYFDDPSGHHLEAITRRYGSNTPA
jgi:catechol 2,3-dioxygenase-like lactoylglutathione lyase family enzyme